ncbi:amidohydrolase family protein [Microbulbifer sp. 2304DJ12-6]|uniref:amidohydrolase family protein n=1 Tax=Microbulbifer sp. 2304DJ12-6 TaxID=3233340 RepID=UPI0039AFBB08
MRIDSHQHFWLLSRGDYDWLGPSFEALYRDFLPDDIRGHLQASDIDQTILVQATDKLAETQYLLSLADENAFIAGVVGWVAMDTPAGQADLQKLSQQPRFLGVRPMLQDINDRNWMLKPELDPAFQILLRENLSFDALVKPEHLDNLHTLMLRYPSLSVVIDHGAKPDIAAGEFDPWAENISRIAKDTNAYCKLSGLLTEANHSASRAEIQPYMQHLLACFGPQRLMWGSDWPVLNLASDYAHWQSIVQTFIAPLPADDQAAIMGTSAQHFYRLHKRHSTI